jgi:hypothetical protein
MYSGRTALLSIMRSIIREAQMERYLVNGEGSWMSGQSGVKRLLILLLLHVVWCDDTPGNYEIYHKRSTDG